MKEFENIFRREIERLEAESVSNGLDMDGTRKLEALARAWRHYSAAKLEEKKEELDGLSPEQLLVLAKGEAESRSNPSSEVQDPGTGSQAAMADG
jgi:hypothetical protein